MGESIIDDDIQADRKLSEGMNSPDTGKRNDDLSQLVAILLFKADN